MAILTGLFNVGMWFYVLVQMSVRLPNAIESTWSAVSGLSV